MTRLSMLKISGRRGKQYTSPFTLGGGIIIILEPDSHTVHARPKFQRCGVILYHTLLISNENEETFSGIRDKLCQYSRNKLLI